MVHEPTDLPNDGVEVLVFETSPYGNLDAIVQHDGRVVYFYLNSQAADSNQAFGTRACWVRNLQPGPYVLNEDEMRQGIAPLLPRTHCKSLESGKLPCPDDLKIVWLEEGNGAALLERNAVDQENFETLAVIPPWSGIDNFLGYAAECAAESPLCWPLPINPKLQQRIDRADEFWHAFASQPDPFTRLQTELLGVYDAHFHEQKNPPADEKNYFSIDGGKFPPRGLIHLKKKDKQVLATVGMSLCPQPAVEMFSQDPTNQRRIELAIELDQDADDALIKKASEAISSLAGYPWRQFSWLGHGHTCQFAGVLPDTDSVLLVSDQILNAANPLRLPRFRDDPVQLHWLLPLSQSHQQALAKNEVSVKELTQLHLTKR